MLLFMMVLLAVTEGRLEFSLCNGEDEDGHISSSAKLCVVHQESLGFDIGLCCSEQMKVTKITRRQIHFL